MKPIYLYVTPYFPSPTYWSGAYCYDAVCALARDDRYEVHVYRPGDGSDYEFGGVRVTTFKTCALPSTVFPLLFSKFNQRSFLAAVERSGVRIENVRVCHAHTATFSIYAQAVKEKNPRCLTLLHHHDLQSFGLNNCALRHCWLYNLIAFPWLRHYHELMDCHVFISEMVRKSFLLAPDASWTDYREYTRQMRGLPFGATKVKNSIVCYNGVDTRLFSKPERQVKESSGRFTIGCICLLVELKDPFVLFDAFAKAGIDDARLILVGTGPLRSACEKYVKERGLRVEFRDEVFHEQLPDFYRSIDLFVLPSYFEGFGCVYVEAWASGVPFITTTGAGVVELIPDSERDLWVAKPHDAVELAAKIRYYYENRPEQHLKGTIDIDAITDAFVNQIEAFQRDLQFGDAKRQDSNNEDNR